MKHPTIQFSQLRYKNILKWYERPIVLKFTLSFKKSTLVILALLIYILWAQVAHAQSLTKSTIIEVPSKRQTQLAHLPGSSVFKDTFLTEVQKHNDELAKEAEIARQAAIKAQQDAEAAKQAQIAQEQAQAPVAPVQAPSQSYGCGDNSYANYIYMHESGCNTSSINSLGCKGIGQSCGSLPCSLYDYNCQNSFFTSYALSRYGSWAAAYNFWVQNHWW